VEAWTKWKHGLSVAFDISLSLSHCFFLFLAIPRINATMKFNQTISVHSPLVNLVGPSWASGESQENGDTMTFKFEGTAVT
jgi:hypothetical protein